jgi:dinuclear metal center YbgI/SA1388 family protein
MVLRDDLTAFLADLYRFRDFEDACENGLQVEGKDKIEKILFGVSFNLPLLEKAIEKKADAVIVHHGVFQQGVFKLKGPLKNKIKILLIHDISLFGIHLPMDGHPECGHNALLLKSIEAENIEPFNVGFRGVNTKGYSLDKILDTLHHELRTPHFNPVEPDMEISFFPISMKYGFHVLSNGPEIPKKIAVVTGESSDLYETAVDNGVDTYFCGAIKERTLAFSNETRTNFINLGHYYSEKPGVLALMKSIGNKFDVQTEYIEIPNPV